MLVQKYFFYRKAGVCLNSVNFQLESRFNAKIAEINIQMQLKPMF